MRSGNRSMTWRRIPFEDARIEVPDERFSPILIVEGVSPYANMRYELSPLVYKERPEYWGIEVIGQLSKSAIPSITPFELVLPLDFEVGTKGIEIIGPGKWIAKIDCEYVRKENPDDGSRVLILGERKENLREEDDEGIDG